MDKPSKSQRKREMLERQALGEQLMRLSEEELDEFELPQPLREAIAASRRMNKRGALYRQRQWIGKLMRSVDIEPILETLAQKRALDRARSATHHLTEIWRDRLLAEGDQAIDELIAQYPGIDRQEVRQLVQRARRERTWNTGPSAQRSLFRYLRECIGPP